VFLDKYLDSKNMDSMGYGSKILFARVVKQKLTNVMWNEKLVNEVYVDNDKWVRIDENVMKCMRIMRSG